MPRALNNVFRYLALIVVSAALALPLVWAIASSLKPLHEVYAFPPSFRVVDPQWTNFSKACDRLPLLGFLVNSLFIAVVSVAGAMLTSSMTGYALARIRFRGRSLCLAAVIGSVFVPATVLLLPRFFMYDLLGWMNTYKPLIVPAWLGGGAFNILLYRQFFRTISPTVSDASRLDGATTWQTYWLVVLPIARPATVTVLLLSFVYHWQEFLDPLLYLSDMTTFPVSLGLRMYQSMAGTWANLLMAASLVALVPIVIVFVLCQRQLMQGLGVWTESPRQR